MDILTVAPETSGVPWFSLGMGLLGLGWITTVVVIALALLGIAAIWRVITGFFGPREQNSLHVPSGPTRHLAHPDRT
ncbi:hypothetical protein [Chitinimonas naiadis]